LLAYVRNGGNLLVSGPVARDEHWHVVDRLSPLGITASLEPLTMHAAGPDAPPKAPAIPFDQQKQLLAEYWKFPDGAREKKVVVGKGILFLEAYPAELSRDSLFAAQVYEPLLTHLAIPAPFQMLSGVSSGVLIYPMELQDAVLYVLESETDQDTDLNLQDAATGAQLQLRLPAQHGALALIDKKTKQIIARYGF
jgi:hypothetical protein